MSTALESILFTIIVIVTVLLIVLSVGIYGFRQERAKNQIFTETGHEAGGTIYRTMNSGVCLRDDGTMVVTGNMTKVERF